MQFSDTTNLNGLIQRFEYLTRLESGEVTGDLLKQVTAAFNASFDHVMPLVLSFSDYVRWDDINHTDQPNGTFNIVSGQADYKITADGNSLDILNITRLRALTSSSGTEYQTLERMYVNDERAQDAMLPNPSVSGVPTHYLEVGNRVFLYPEPNYAATNGAQIFFERELSYFASTDTTKEPGIPKPFHDLLALHTALEWVHVNRSNENDLIRGLEMRIQRAEQNLKDLISKRNPYRSQFTVPILKY